MMQCQLIDGNEAKNSIVGGYVKSGNKFFITNNLEIFPNSKSLILLKGLKVEYMSFFITSTSTLEVKRFALTSVLCTSFFSVAICEITHLVSLKCEL